MTVPPLLSLTTHSIVILVASTYHGVGSSDNMRRGKTEQPGVLVDSTPRLFALLGALGGTLG